MSVDLENLGGDGSTIEKIDSQIGKYKDPVNTGEIETRLPTEQLPKAPPPSPFKGLK